MQREESAAKHPTAIRAKPIKQPLNKQKFSHTAAMNTWQIHPQRDGRLMGSRDQHCIPNAHHRAPHPSYRQP
ncbi:hypothetical protein AFM18_07915 [Achromobacter spanius]|uniref:Uncharacterized protein n=1 Tax=Achromobacter spanius TaxID=217203 RepID=A0AAW3I6J1_9BURK|nr:hypothetical protein AFM18_07915 [Achromobacter spanius]